MISDKTVEWHRRAAMALDSFTPRKREQIKKSLDRLVKPSYGSYIDGPRRISAAEPLYVMRVAPGIRVIFQKTPLGIVVEDVVRKETLNSFIERDSDTGRVLQPKNRSKRKPRRTGFLKAGRLKRAGER